MVEITVIPPATTLNTVLMFSTEEKQNIQERKVIMELKIDWQTIESGSFAQAQRNPTETHST